MRILVNGFGEVRARPEMQRLEASTADSGGGALVEGPPVHHLAMSSPSGVRDGALAAIGFSRILNTQDDLSRQQDDGPR